MKKEMKPIFKEEEMVRVSNHPDKKVIGKEVRIIKVLHSRYNSLKGFVSEYVYKVSDGIKSLGWARECDLQKIEEKRKS